MSRPTVRDALATAASLAREACWLAAERVAGQRLSATALGPEWLTAALQAQFPGVRVRAVERLSGDAGTTDRIRLAVDYDEVGTGDPPPASVFVKLAPAHPGTRLFVNLMRLGSTEVQFYRLLAPRVPVDTPGVFHADSTGRAQRFVLVLEDLVARGARFTDVSEPLGVEAARAVVRALARLHAAFWFHADLAWLGDDDRIGRIGRFLSAVSVGPALRRFGDIVPPELRAGATRITAARERLDAAWRRGALTLLHGDAPAGTIYFLGAGVGFFDWQVVQRGQGMRDVTYFLVQSLPTELRRSCERELIGLYLATLAEHGVTGLDPDEAWAQHRLHALYAWIAALVTAAPATLQSERIVRAGLARSSAAVMDLDSLQALARA
jgi:hypothetical protein